VDLPSENIASEMRRVGNRTNDENENAGARGTSDRVFRFFGTQRSSKLPTNHRAGGEMPSGEARDTCDPRVASSNLKYSLYTAMIVRGD